MTSPSTNVPLASSYIEVTGRGYSAEYVAAVLETWGAVDDGNEEYTQSAFTVECRILDRTPQGCEVCGKGHPTYFCCDRCDYETHCCPGCGAPLSHSRGVCDECEKL